MALDDHVRRGHPITFAVLTLWALIEMIITAILVSVDNRSRGGLFIHSVRDRERFLLFASLWTLLFSILYIVGFLRASGSFLFSIASHGVWLFLTWVFWLAGAAAITDSLDGGLDCGTFNFSHCNQLNASEAFAWLSFVTVTFAFVFVVFLGVRSARTGNGFGGPLIV